MPSSSMKILMKALLQIIAMVLALGGALLVLLNFKGRVDPAVQGILFDLFLIPFTVILIGGFFVVSFIKMLLQEQKNNGC